MTSSSSAAGALAADERRALADLLDEVGPDAPACCAGWTTAHLAAHLIMQERRPDAMPGYALEMVPGLARLGGWAHRVEDATRTRSAFLRRPWSRSVRSGAPRWSPLTWPGLRQLNVPEFAIHHEDVRRAQPGWSPRELPATVQDRLWSPATLYAPGGLPDGGAWCCAAWTGPASRPAHRRGRAHGQGERLELLLWASQAGAASRG